MHESSCDPKCGDSSLCYHCARWFYQNIRGQHVCSHGRTQLHRPLDQTSSYKGWKAIGATFITNGFFVTKAGRNPQSTRVMVIRHFEDRQASRVHNFPNRLNNSAVPWKQAKSVRAYRNNYCWSGKQNHTLSTVGDWNFGQCIQGRHATVSVRDFFLHACRRKWWTLTALRLPGQELHPGGWCSH